MSYEIIYNVFTIKQKGVYFPFVVMGSNNCYEVVNNRRERNLYIADFFFKDFKDKNKEFKTLQDLKSSFNYELIDKDLEGGNIQGRFKTSNSILKNFLNKVIENNEIKIKSQISSLYYFLDKLNEKEKGIINKAIEEVNESINEILTAEEEKNKTEELYNKLNDDLKHKLKDYKGGYSLFYTPFEEYKINKGLEQFKVKRIIEV